jgi:hypothetical protein
MLIANYLDDWVLKAQQMVALNKPAKRDYKSVETYMFNRKPLLDEEYGFIYQQEDLITLRDGREMAFLDSFTEKMLKTFHCSLLQVSTSQPLLLSKFKERALADRLVEIVLYQGN